MRQPIISQTPYSDNIPEILNEDDEKFAINDLFDYLQMDIIIRLQNGQEIIGILQHVSCDILGPTISDNDYITVTHNDQVATYYFNFMSERPREEVLQKLYALNGVTLFETAAPVCLAMPGFVNQRLYLA